LNRSHFPLLREVVSVLTGSYEVLSVITVVVVPGKSRFAINFAEGVDPRASRYFDSRSLLRKLKSEPLVVVILGIRQVHSIPDILGREVNFLASSSSSNSESVFTLLALDFLDKPSLSARSIILGPKIDVGLSAVSAY
jgi:hypothetical protein